MKASCRIVIAAVAALVALPILAFPSPAQEPTRIQYLSGIDKDHTVPWEFYMTRGRRAGHWDTIPVPSQWELEGFGSYHYGSDTIPDERGLYRHHFQVPADWRGKTVFIVFEGSMTDTEVKVNGTLAGPIHQGAFYRFSYDVTGLLNYGGDNLIEATVSKHSANESVNRAERESDFWVFGGIFRPVYLEAFPTEFIHRTALDARADGSFRADVYLGGDPSDARVTGQIVDLEGDPVGEPFSAPVPAGAEEVTLRTRIEQPRLWSPEFPNRYRVEFTLDEDGAPIHTTTETFGFRTIEVRPRDGIYLNGVRVRMKGVDHHTFWPDAGRTSSRQVSELDVNLIKDMNMNAVRMSHYPPDRHFLEVTDSLGLFVLDELTGWQKYYDTDIGEKLVKEMVTRDVNHPSVIFWDNGNEGGFNFDLDDDFGLYDPQHRAVLHPWEIHGGINTAHYKSTECCAGKVFLGRDIIMPTEALHGLYDGGAGAGLRDYWDLLRRNPSGGGLFIWAFLDEGVVRTDRADSIDTAGNRAPDGIVGPYRQKEGSFFAIKEIWSPVYFEDGEWNQLPPSFTGEMRVENRYNFTNLDQITFHWDLASFPAPGDPATGHSVDASGTLRGPDVAPHRVGVLDLELPADWASHDALYLTATDPHGREIYRWSWMISSAARIANRIVTDGGAGPVTSSEAGNTLTATAGGLVARFSEANGELIDVERDGTDVSLANGPRLVGGQATLDSLSYREDGNDLVIDAEYDGGMKSVEWRVHPSGWLELHYRYGVRGHLDNLGVTFDYPEDRVLGMTWLGKGPYRVWKNRLAGAEYDVWHKDYNDTMTGVTWDYPEFKGYHAGLQWAVIQTTELPITVVTSSDDVFLRMLTPSEPAEPGNTTVAFPDGDISFLNGIAPIGSKFTAAADMTPSGRQNLAVRGGARTPQYDYTGTLYFYFGARGTS